MTDAELTRIESGLPLMLPTREEAERLCVALRKARREIQGLHSDVEAAEAVTNILQHRVDELSEARALADKEAEQLRQQLAGVYPVVEKLRTENIRLQSSSAWLCGCGAYSGVNLVACGRCTRLRSESEVCA